MKNIWKILLCLALASCSGQAVQDDTSGIKDMPDLAGKRVSVISGSLQDLVISDYIPKPEVLRLSSPAELIASVANGKADYCLMDSSSFIGAGAEDKGLRPLFSSDIVAGGVGMAFQRDNQALHDEINTYLARIRQDGRWKEIVDRWTTGDVSQVLMPRIDMDPAGEKLVVGIMNNFPFSFIQNGQYAGLEIEMLEIFAAETGRQMVFEMIDFSGMIAAVSTGKIDIAACTMTITEERAKQVLFSDSYYYCKTACFCRDGQAAKAKKAFFVRVKDSFHDNLIQEDRWKLVLEGLWETLVISFFAILAGTLLGALLCWMKISGSRPVKGAVKVFVEIIRGIPILVLLMLMFYVVFASSSVSARWVAVVAFAINFGAYASEIFHTGIEGVDKGQTEAGLAMGFSRLRTFLNFVLPQAAKKIIPVYKGDAVSLIKSTSVVGYIAIMDLTKASDVIRSRTFDAFFPLVVVSILYFFIAWLLSKALDRLSKKIA